MCSRRWRDCLYRNMRLRMPAKAENYVQKAWTNQGNPLQGYLYVQKTWTNQGNPLQGYLYVQKAWTNQGKEQPNEKVGT